MSQKFTDWSATAGNNTTVGTGAIDIDEGCAPGNVNDALREIMAACVRSAGLAGLTGSGSRPAGTQAGQFWTDIADASNPVIYWYDGTDDIEFATISNSGNTIVLSSAVSASLEVVNDLTPQLGGDLDVNGKQITSASNGNVIIDPHGTGKIFLGADTFWEDDQDTGFNYVADASFTVDVAGSAVLTFGAGKTSFPAATALSTAALTSSTTISLPMTGASKKTLTLDHNTTITVSGEVADQTVEVWITQGSIGGTAAWSGVDKWIGGSAPTLSTTTGEIDIIILASASDGTTVIGSHLGAAG